MEESQLKEIYLWIDRLPLSRPKRNIWRDFSDAVLMAEVIKYYYPKSVDLHNYPGANSITQKTYNWTTLSQKVLKKLNCGLNESQISELAYGKPGTIESLLCQLRPILEQDKQQPDQSFNYNQQQQQQQPYVPIFPLQTPQNYLPALPQQSPQSITAFQQQFSPIPQMNQFPYQQQPQPLFYNQMNMQPQPQQQQQGFAPSFPNTQKSSYKQLPGIQSQPFYAQQQQQPFQEEPRREIVKEKRIKKQNIESSVVVEKQSLKSIKKSSPRGSKSEPEPVEILKNELQQKNIKITELSETIQMLELKISKLQQLLSLKDQKIRHLSSSSSLDS